MYYKLQCSVHRILIFSVRTLSKNDISGSSSSREQQEEGKGKDLRALIGLELVVDYVKEPKEDPADDDEQSHEVTE